MTKRTASDNPKPPFDRAARKAQLEERAIEGVKAMTEPHFPFRIDVWDDQGNSIMQHVAGVDDFETAVATYWAASLRQEARTIEKSWEG